jgi:hypothetical protein
MKVECEICGAYTEDPNEIEWAKKYRTCPECRHIGSLFIAEEDESMKEFTIEIKVKAPSSGCAVDWITRQTMDEVGYCEVQTVNVFNEDGRDVTDDEETYSGFDKDYMTAVSKEKQEEVDLTFTHELAKLNVKVQKDNDYNSSQALFVTTLEILNLKNQGYFVRNATPSKTWTVSTSSTEGTFAMGTGNRNLANPDTDDKTYVIEQLLLPQGIKKASEASRTTEFKEACVHITYTIGTEVFDGYYALNNIFDDANDYTFEGGNEYTLTITVGPDPIHFTPEVTKWVEQPNKDLPIE